MLRISVFSPVGLANPTAKDWCQLRSGPKPCGQSLSASALSRPNRTGPLLGNSANLLPRYKTSAGHEKQKVQYREISHACRAQKGLQPIITILLVMLLKISSTAGTRGRLLTCWMQIFLPPQQNKSAECWQLIRLEGYSRKAAIFTCSEGEERLRLSGSPTTLQWQLIIWALVCMERWRKHECRSGLILDTGRYYSVKFPKLTYSYKRNEMWNLFKHSLGLKVITLKVKMVALFSILPFRSAFSPSLLAALVRTADPRWHIRVCVCVFDHG